MFSVKVYKSCTVIENLLSWMCAEQGGKQNKPTRAGDTWMFLKSVPLEPCLHRGTLGSRSQNSPLTVSVVFSSFRSRTELTFKVQLLRDFVLQCSEHAPGKMHNGLTWLPKPSPHTMQFMLSQHYMQISSNLLYPFY